jgi:kinesin family protein 2/24
MNATTKRKVRVAAVQRALLSSPLSRYEILTSFLFPFLHQSSTTSSSSSSVTASAKKDATRAKIERMELEREERRREMIQRKQARKKEQEDNVAKGNPGDIDFIGMVSEWRRKNISSETTAMTQGNNNEVATTNNPNTGNICIAVRKRPMSSKERKRIDHDSVSVGPPKSVTIHSAKFKVDGITKYLTHSTFHFDHAFGEGSTTPQIYMATTMPLVDHVLKTRGRATVFCYGQTGSGKTYTMNGIQQILAYDLYGEQSDEGLEIHVAFFELYGGFIQDLLHDRKRCKLLEDGKGEVNITGLTEVAAPTPEDFLRIIEQGNGSRTTHITEANDTSSRSHAICQVFLRDKNSGKLKGKLALVDLAGSERGSDTKSHNTQRRAESADINTSLLSLKECIRALGQKSTHVPYRGSKLTLILKDCFSPESKTTMITTVSPGASSSDHSLNTLRYADRIKEQRVSSCFSLLK